MNKEKLHIPEKFLDNLEDQFCVDLEALKVAYAIKGKEPIALYLGYNPTTYCGDIVVLTKEGYIFVPLDGKLEVVGEVWSHVVFLRLYYAQVKLSAFLKELGQKLNIKVVDRCLYGAYLRQKIVSPSEETKYSTEIKDFCMEKQMEFRETYKEQLRESVNYENWKEYHNHGFGYRYLPCIEIEAAINSIYGHRNLMEENNYWQETEKIIRQLRELLHFESLSLKKLK